MIILNKSLEKKTASTKFKLKYTPTSGSFIFKLLKIICKFNIRHFVSFSVQTNKSA